VLLAEVVATSRAVAGASGRNEKVALLAELLRATPADDVEVVASVLCGAPRQGRVGVGWATARIVAGATVPSLGVADLDRLFDGLAAAGGPGVQATRRDLLGAFGARATPDEADFVVRLLTGELRQGALAGLVEQAVARAEGIPVAVVRRAAMLSGNLPATAELARTAGRAGLESVTLRLGVPVSPMLAAGAPGVDEAVADLGAASVEWKLDGIRVQAHVRRDRVRLWTRNLNEITDHLPGVVTELASLDLPAAVLDGEVIGVGPTGRPVMFQDTMGATAEAGWVAAAVEMRAHWFDVLHVAGGDLLDAPLSDRLDVLASLPGLRRMPGERTDDPGRAAVVLEEALAAGHEGVVLKSLGSPYAAGRRGKAWRKVKPVHTLDLVVIGVEWGSGRRRGMLSNLHLGALGPDGVPVMVGKTFKGLTDELLAWQTAELLAREAGREGHVVWVRPELVVEVALDGAQRSSRYPGGVALRFARVRRYRTDKSPTEADTLAAVRALLPC
jgi:DNA ligase-1